MRQSRLLVGLILVVCLVASCGPTPEPKVVKETVIVAGTPEVVVVEKVVTATPERKRGGTLVVGTVADTQSFDPHTFSQVDGAIRNELIYNHLVDYDEGLNIVPTLAERWEISPDGTVYTFDLRKGVKWQNGREMVADDVVYSFERIMDPETAAPSAGYWSVVSSVEAVDQYTVKVTLRVPSAGFLDVLCFVDSMIVPKEVIERYGDLKRHPLGTGPFMLEEWVPDNRTVFKRHPEGFFIEGLPYLDEIVYQVIPEEPSIIAALRAGRVDFALLKGDIKSALELKGEPGLNTTQIAGIAQVYVVFNTRREPFSNPLVRRAASLALDRQQILTAAIFGAGSVTGPIPPSLEAYVVPITEFETFKQDVAKAKALMTEAGYPSGFETTLVAATSAPATIAAATVIQSQFKEIGIDVEILPLEDAARGPLYGAGPDADVDFDMMFNITGGYPQPLLPLRNSYHTEGSWNWAGISYPDYDALIDKAGETIDVPARTELIKQAQVMLAEEMIPYLWLYTPDLIFVMRDDVKGFVPHPINTAFRSLWAVRLDR